MAAIPSLSRLRIEVWIGVDASGLELEEREWEVLDEEGR